MHNIMKRLISLVLAMQIRKLNILINSSSYLCVHGKKEGYNVTRYYCYYRCHVLEGNLRVGFKYVFVLSY